jgi:hypothetical protein
MIGAKSLSAAIALSVAALMAARPALAQTAAARPASPQAARPAPGAQDDTRETNLHAYTELLRSDLRAEKVAIITDVMQFTDAEDEKFWPVYREYEAELAKINDARIALIKQYADAYGSLTDAMADKLARGALDLEAQRNALKLKYYERLASVMSPKTAARFLQVENQILLLLDLQIAASLPIAQ